MSSAREDKTPRGLPPVRKSLGQHFLNDRRILQRLGCGQAAETRTYDDDAMHAHVELPLGTSA